MTNPVCKSASQIGTAASTLVSRCCEDHAVSSRLFSPLTRGFLRAAILVALAAAACQPAVGSPGRVAASAQLAYVDKSSDKVGSGSQATPDKSPDGHFRLSVTASDTVTTITLKTADASGKPCCGQVWNTVPRDGWWILGVFKAGKQLNPVDVNVVDKVSGSATYDIYAADSGYFKPGQHFIAYVNFASGACVSAVADIGGPSGAGGRCPPDLTPTTAIAWNDSAIALRGRNGTQIGYFCPRGGTPGQIYGANTYADSSSVCTAAVHVGLILWNRLTRKP